METKSDNPILKIKRAFKKNDCDAVVEITIEKVFSEKSFDNFLTLFPLADSFIKLTFDQLNSLLNFNNENLQHPEVEFFIKSIIELKKLEIKIESGLKRIKIIDCLTLSGLYLEKMRLEYEDVNAIEVASYLLNKKLKEVEKSEPLVGSDQELEEVLIQKFIDYLSEDDYSAEVFELFNNASSFLRVRFLLQSFPLNPKKVQYLNGTFFLKSKNTNYENWNLSHKKYIARKNLDTIQSEKDKVEFFSFSNEMLYSEKNKIATYHHLISMNSFEKSGLPFDINLNGDKNFRVDKFLSFYSSLKVSVFYNWIMRTNNSIKKFSDFKKNLFFVGMKNHEKGQYSNPVFSFSKDFLVERFLDDLGDNLDSILDYLSHDFYKRKSLDLFETPFIKIDDNYICFPFVIDEIDWAVLLERRILQDGTKSKIHARVTNFDRQAWTKDREEKFERLFLEAHFKSLIAGYVYSQSEIDLAIYDEGTLLIFELKLTYPRKSALEINAHQEQSLKKGFSQLQKHHDYLFVEENRIQLLEEMGVEAAPKDLNIHFVLVDNTFEQDGLHQFDNLQIIKTSLFELEILLEKEFVYYEEMESTEPKLEQLYITKNPNLKDLVFHIENQTIWKKVINFDDLKPVNREISVGDLKVKYQA